MKPKCKICGKEVDKNTGFAVAHGSRNFYYCSEEEYRTWEKKIKNAEADFREDVNFIFDLNFDLVNDNSWDMIDKFLKELCKSYSKEEILWCFNSEMGKWAQIIQRKSFASEFLMLRYLFAIVRNNIKEFLGRNPLPVEEPRCKEVDYYMAPVNYKRSKVRRAMVDIERLGDDSDG